MMTTRLTFNGARSGRSFHAVLLLSGLNTAVEAHAMRGRDDLPCRAAARGNVVVLIVAVDRRVCGRAVLVEGGVHVFLVLVGV